MPKTSDRIRARLAAAGERFRANDNIAQFIEPGELEALTEEVAGQVGRPAAEPRHRHGKRPQHPRNRRARRADVLERDLRGTLRALAGPDGVSERHVVRRALPRRPDHHPLDVRAPPAEHPRQLLDRHLPGQERPRAVEVLPARRMDHRAAADPGGDDHPDRRPRGGRDVGRGCGRRGEGGAHVRDAPRRARARVGHDHLGASRQAARQFGHPRGVLPPAAGNEGLRG